MGFMANLKGQQALTLQSKGRNDEARAKYEEAIKAGMNQPRLLLAYSVLLIRAGEYEKARDLLVKTQKAPGITADQKSQLFMNYAVCAYKLGDAEKGLALLEKQHLPPFRIRQSNWICRMACRKHTLKPADPAYVRNTVFRNQLPHTPWNHSRICTQ